MLTNKIIMLARCPKRIEDLGLIVPSKLTENWLDASRTNDDFCMIRNIMDYWHQLIKTKDMTIITSNSRLKKLDSLEKDAHRTSKPMKNFTVILHCKYKFGHVGGKAVPRQR